MEDYRDYGIEIPNRRNHGNVKVICPQCRDRRSNHKDRSLSVNLDEGIWHCHYCGWSGKLKNNSKPHTQPMQKVYARPQDTPPTANYSDKMLAYLISRGISEAVARKLKVSEGKEFIPQENKEMNTLQFRYYLENELINVKYRTGNKHFKLCKDAELIPYNIDSTIGESYVIITEGEFDCLSFVEAGFKSVISVPNGASSNTSYLDDFMEGWFDDKETIYIASDTDTKGVELRLELISRFGAERCKIITYGNDCKDANEHLIKYGKESLKACVNKAEEVPIEGVYSVKDYEDELDSLFEQGLPRGLTIGLPNFDELVSIETRRLMIVTGVPTSGKSEFVDEMCIRLSLLHGWKCAFFSPENYPLSYHASKWIPRVLGTKFNKSCTPIEQYERAKQYVNEHFSHILPKAGNTLENVLESATMQVRRKGIKVLVLDPLNRIESDYGTMSETTYIGKILDRLTEFAQRNNVLVILVAHPRKVQDETGKPRVPSMYDIKGSSTFYDKADYGVIVHRNKDDENEDKNYTLVKIEKVKFRHLGDKGQCFFKFFTQNGRYIPYDLEAPKNGLFWDSRNYLDEKPYEMSGKPIQDMDKDLLQRINEFENGINESDVPF